MHQNAKLAVAPLVGVAIGAGAIGGLKAQGTKKVAYVIAEVEVTDQPAFQQYTANVPATLVPYHGHIIVRGKPDAREGTPLTGNIVIVAFDSLADADRWYSTPPYSELIPERQRASKSRVYIVEGVPE
jgi:uncharacterized protein (DUF1330 family)